METTRTLYYAEAALNATIAAKRTGSATANVSEAWAYIVAHERCHALATAASFMDEQAADRCARAHGTNVARWSVYA